MTLAHPGDLPDVAGRGSLTPPLTLTSLSSSRSPTLSDPCRFTWSVREGTEPVLVMTGQEHNGLLDGIDLFRVCAEEELSFDSVS